MLLALLTFVILDVTWNPQLDATSFEVAVKHGRKKEIVYPVSTNLMSVEIKLTETTKVKVRAVNAHGKSGWSKQMTVNKSHICIEHGR